MPIHVEVPGHGIVEFPDGTSEDVMRKALSTLAAPEKPAVTTAQAMAGGPSAMGLGNGTAETAKGIYGYAKEHPAQAGAMLASAASAPFTGGMSLVPGMAAAFTAGAAGAAGGNLLAGKPVGEGVVREGLTSAAGPFVGKAVGATGDFIASKALPTVRAAIKTPVTLLRRQAGASIEGIDAQADKVARIVLKNRWASPDSAIDAVKAAETGVQSELANVPAGTAIDIHKRLPTYLGDLQTKVSGQIAPRADLAALAGAQDDIMNGPLSRPAVAMGKATRVLRNDVSPAEGMDIARKTSKFATKKQYGELKGIETEAHKTGERALRDSVKDAVPSIAPHLDAQREGLTALPVLDAMKVRQGNADIVPLGSMVMGAGGGNIPARIGLALTAKLVKQGQLRGAFGMDTLGPALSGAAGEAGFTTPFLVRALLSQMQGSEEPHK